MASNWLDEVYKPSRRFKKINFGELEAEAMVDEEPVARTRRRGKDEQAETVFVEEDIAPKEEDSLSNKP